GWAPGRNASLTGTGSGQSTSGIGFPLRRIGPKPISRQAMVAVGLISIAAGAPGVPPSRNKSSDCAPAPADFVMRGALWASSASGLYLTRSWYRKLRCRTSSVSSPSRSWSTRRRWSGFATTAPRSNWARLAGRNTLPHSTSIVTRPRYGSSACAVARTSSSNNATSTSRRGAAASSRRATAWPTRPEPPRIIVVRSRRSMQSLDGVDLARREPAVRALLQPPQPHRPVRDAVQPLHLEPERFGEAAHDALAPLGERELDLDAASHRPHTELRDPHRATVDRNRAPERRRHLGRRAAVRPQPVGARHGEARVHEAVRGRPVRRQQQQPRGHHVQPSHVREARHLGEELVHGASPLRVAAA